MSNKTTKDLEVVEGVNEEANALEAKKTEAVAKINAILTEYDFDLGVVGFALVPKIKK